jgi:hypothetical protein
MGKESETELQINLPIISVILYLGSPSSSIKIALTEFKGESFAKSSVVKYIYLKP